MKKKLFKFLCFRYSYIELDTHGWEWDSIKHGQNVGRTGIF